MGAKMVYVIFEYTNEGTRFVGVFDDFNIIKRKLKGREWFGRKLELNKLYKFMLEA